MLHYASIRSYLCPTSLRTVWLMLMWSVLFFGPKLPEAAHPPTHTLVIDRGAPSVTEHSTCFYYKKTVSSLMHRRSPGTADTLWTQYGKSSINRAHQSTVSYTGSNRERKAKGKDIMRHVNTFTTAVQLTRLSLLATRVFMLRWLTQ